MNQISANIAAIAANQQSNSAIPTLPRILFSEDLARICHLRVSTIQHYTGNAKRYGHLLPKWFKMPGARRLAWLESDVAEWLQAGLQAHCSQIKVKRGRPTKAAQVAKSLFIQE